MRILIVYYSRTGHTEQVARELAARCLADTDRILDDGIDRHGAWGYLRSGWQAACRTLPAIGAPTQNPDDYDLVVLGTPVWNWGLSAPMRTYARQHAHQFRQVAFFCTEGGAGAQRVFDELQRLCGKPPKATLVVKEQALDPARHAQALADFVAQLEPPAVADCVHSITAQAHGSTISKGAGV
jgi:flavodoxin